MFKIFKQKIVSKDDPRLLNPIFDFKVPMIEPFLSSKLEEAITSVRQLGGGEVTVNLDGSFTFSIK